MTSVSTGRRVLLGAFACWGVSFVIVVVSRALRNDAIFDGTELLLWGVFALNLLVRCADRPQAITYETVKAYGESEHAWTDVRRAFFKPGYVVFDFGKPWWNRPWLILPRDPYDRARALLILDRALPPERVVRQDV